MPPSRIASSTSPVAPSSAAQTRTRFLPPPRRRSRAFRLGSAEQETTLRSRTPILQRVTERPVRVRIRCRGGVHGGLAEEAAAEEAPAQGEGARRPSPPLASPPVPSPSAARAGA